MTVIIIQGISHLLGTICAAQQSKDQNDKERRNKLHVQWVLDVVWVEISIYIYITSIS